MDANDDTSGCGAVERDIARVCSILEAVAGHYSESSEEASAVRKAALAYQVVRRHEILNRHYDRLRAASGGELTEETKSRLRRIGIEPDEFGENEGEDAGGS